jgi:hypothetical protein
MLWEGKAFIKLWPVTVAFALVTWRQIPNFFHEKFVVHLLMYCQQQVFMRAA